MRILYLTSWFPYPLDTGSRVTNHHAIRQLSRHHEISLLSFIDGEEELQHLPAMANSCTDVTCVLRERQAMVRLKYTLGLLSSLPRSVLVARSKEMFEAVARIVIENDPDCAIVDNIALLEYLIPMTGLPKILFHHNVDSVVAGRQFELESSRVRRLRLWLTYLKAAAYERRMSQRADAHAMVSRVDEEELLKLVPEIDCIDVIGNGVDIESFSVEDLERQRDSVIFTGLPRYSANVDALRYFCGEVFPKVKQNWKDVVLRVTGDFSGQSVCDLESEENIVFTGYLDDVKPAIASSRVAIAPIRLGSGTRLKILEAMALGTPVVSTTVGAEGLDVSHGKDILIANSPSEFADSLVQLRNDQELWTRLSTNGRLLVRERYDWKVLGERFDKFVREVCGKS